ELYIPRTRSAQNFAELRRVHRHARAVPQAEERGVKQVVKLGPELGIEALLEPLTADKGDVEVPAPRIAQPALVQRVIRHGEWRGERERAGVEPAFRRPLAGRQNRVLRAIAPADVEREIGQSGLVGRRDTQWNAALEDCNTADFPVSDH